jgi:hypothetical protein
MASCAAAAPLALTRVSVQRRLSNIAPRRGTLDRIKGREARATTALTARRHLRGAARASPQAQADVARPAPVVAQRSPTPSAHAPRSSQCAAHASAGSYGAPRAHHSTPRRARPAVTKPARVSRVARVAPVVAEQRVVPVDDPSLVLGGRLEHVVDPMLVVLGRVPRGPVVDGDGGARDAEHRLREYDQQRRVSLLSVRAVWGLTRAPRTVISLGPGSCVRPLCSPPRHSTTAPPQGKPSRAATRRSAAASSRGQARPTPLPAGPCPEPSG